MLVPSDPIVILDNGGNPFTQHKNPLLDNVGHSFGMFLGPSKARSHWVHVMLIAMASQAFGLLLPPVALVRGWGVTFSIFIRKIDVGLSRALIWYNAEPY
jgi:hypothetical protein